MNLKKLQIMSNRVAGGLLDLTVFLKGYNPLPPAFILLILTYKCDLNCDFCFQKRQRKNVFSEMTLEDARAIAGNIRRSFKIKPKIHLFGGEPTLNKDFGGILHCFSELDFRLSLTTNGMGAVRYADDLVREKGLKEINLSLNTMDFERALAFLEALERKEQERKIFVNLSCPINETNQYDLAKIIRRFENSYADCITFQQRMFTDLRAVKIDTDALAGQMKEIKKNGYGVPVLFFPDIEVSHISDYYKNPSFPRGVTKCLFPWFTLCVQPGGDITPCDIIPCDEAGIVMGNAKNESLGAVWNNEKFKVFRRKMQSRGMVSPFCDRCCHRQYD